MSRYEELSKSTISMLQSNDITWDEHRRIYFTKLHKEFYLKETEAKSEEYLIEFCSLVNHLQEHLEYGVSVEWGDSELNKYVYRHNKEKLKEQFPLTINALSRFYDDSDIIAFYKKVLKAKDPTIIDLIGTTGAGKTTFCQQFVDKEGKEILEKTITPSGNSTIIQTDIVILENTRSRLFLKARTKKDIIRDIILVALSIDTEYTFDLKKSINSNANKAGLKRADEKEIKLESEVFQGVYNLFRTETLIKEFLDISKDLQKNFSSEDDIQNYINNNMDNSDLVGLLEKIINEELDSDNFYGYRHEMNLENELILEKTIIPTKTFNKYKEKEESFKDVISYRILFEQAVLVLNCDDKAKAHLPQKFREGIVFRDSQGHKKSEQVGIATDFEVKNKILLIPAGTGGELVDDKYVEELKNIIVSEPKQNIVVITKLDKASSYEYYTDGDYDEFIENLKDQVVTTHNNLIERLEDQDEQDSGQAYQFDRNAVVKKFIESFDNAYLSKITKDKSGNFDAELHKIVCRNKSSQEIDPSDIEDIKIIESWYDLIYGILERQNRITLVESGLKAKCSDPEKKEDIICDLADSMEGMLTVCYKNIKWDKELDRALSLYSGDFRNIYHELYMWNNRSILRDISTSGYNIEEKVGKFVKYINSLVLKADNSKNAVETILESVLAKYLNDCYIFDQRFNVANIAKQIISNAISRAAIISYKLYDRDITNNGSSKNISIIYNNPAEYVTPSKPMYKYGVNRRTYFTDTAYYLGIYCNLWAKYRYNIENHYIDIFKTVIEAELEKLDGKVQ